MKVDKVENSRHVVWICLILVLATVAVYFQTGDFDFTNYDDPEYVYENKRVKNGLTLDSVQWAFSTTYLSNWHPLTWLSHMLVVDLLGLDAGNHHLVNMLLHVVNTLLLFLMLRRMTGAIWRSAFVAALFAIHPLHIESVAWVAGRKDLLSTLFGLLAIWSYHRYVRFQTRGKLMPVFLFFLLSLMAKPMLVTLPFVLLLLDYWPLKRFGFGINSQAGPSSFSAESKAVLFLEKVPLLALSAASCVVTVYAQLAGGSVASLEVYPLHVRIANALVAYATYIGKMFWPANLAVIYPHPGRWPVWLVIISGLLMVSITWLAIRCLKTKPWIIVGWLWFVGTLVPVIGLVQVGNQSMADRYTYVPLIGLFIVLAWTLPDRHKPNQYQKVGLAVVTALIVSGLSVVSWNQVRTWQTSFTLFEQALAVTQNNYIAHYNLGRHLSKEGLHAEAIDHFTKVLENYPKFRLGHLNMGVALSAQGKLDEAIRSYNRALALKPDDATVYNNLGNARYRQGKYPEAISDYLKAVQLDPFYAEAYNGIGAALIGLGKIDKAVTFFKKALEIKPDYTAAQINLKNTLAATQQKAATRIVE